MNALNLLFQFADNFAFVVLAAVGLAVIFGMMGVINLGHGEFIMIGAYGTTLSANAGAPLPVAMAIGVLVTAVMGLILERTIIHRLYDRLFDSMVATWALGLILTQGMRILFGNSIPQVSTPLGNIAYGEFSYSTYRVLLLPVALLVLGGLYVLFTRTEFGIRARATIQDPDTARALGVDTDRMYTATFVIGSALAGLTGALYAPTLTVVPGMGSSFLVEAFVAVVVGGPSVLLGTTLSGGLLGTIDAVFTNLFGTFYGQIAMLLTAIVVIRVLSDGLTGLVETVRNRVEGE
ncbi:urea ABC transporter, permease protein UrtB [Halarchaeum nitratireducens]|uniref:Branched-chain amino acid ABC transporter permease n=1 Tax=Halarchaeum nitratireducens TaxID=489913 RepID=A0A830G8I3_9EURY|nr:MULTISPECIES: urea ABC transporter, permease protein UrtB [Halarchaeum]MBP2249736.1 branched-chain amino acid transport system permease protein [Halarchaeum solikamskense]GGN10886.1 branched-chain amino acid ABC transporter permease [Halarchaeum nitratireducens]